MSTLVPQSKESLFQTSSQFVHRSRSTNRLADSQHFPNDVPKCSPTVPHPHSILSFSCVHVCFYRQEVTSSQLSFLSVPPPGCCTDLQPILLFADLQWLSLFICSSLQSKLLICGVRLLFVSKSRFESGGGRGWFVFWLEKT